MGYQDIMRMHPVRGNMAGRGGWGVRGQRSRSQRGRNDFALNGGGGHDYGGGKKKRSSVHHLFCPTGEKNLRVTNSDISNHHVMRKFDNFCQCDSDRSKNWRTDDQRYFCGSNSNTLSKTLGYFMQKMYKVKDACKIHDMCYETGRPKEVCDNEFHYNFMQLCQDRCFLCNCNFAAAMAWAAVKYKGHDAYRNTQRSPYQRHGKRMMQCRAREHYVRRVIMRKAEEAQRTKTVSVKRKRSI